MLQITPEEVLRYCEAHTTPDSPACGAVAEETRVATDAPRMMVGPVEGMLLTLLARSTGARRVLEIGTFTGYSALKLAEGLADDGEVFTCDVNSETTAIALKHWRTSPHGKKINLILGPALETIDTIPGPFDLVFIDADKANYISYWEACVPKVRRGGLILADNVLWSGRVLEPEKPDDQALAAFNTHVAADDRVEVAILSIRDGVTVACKR